MQIEDVFSQSSLFSASLDQAKSSSDIQWYPYKSMVNFEYMNAFFKGEGRNIFSAIDNGYKIVDIGAADGDIAFFLSSLGSHVTIVDNASTNFNNCEGIKYLQANMDNSVKFIERDLDFASKMFDEQYDLAIFLGILYHLRNPMAVLISLAETVERMVVSTTVFSRLSPGGDIVEGVELATLVPCRQINNDPTNYWMFTPASLRTLLKRSGWLILDEFRTGDVGTSSIIGGDERMYCYCQRVANWEHLRLHHDF